MITSLKNKIVHNTFEVTISMKGISGVLEIIAGGLLLFLKMETVRDFFMDFTSHRLVQGAEHFTSGYLTKSANDFTANTQYFLAIYFLFYGACNIFLVVSLFRGKLWAYPIAIVFFMLFTAYLGHRFLTHPSGTLLVFIIFDVFLTVLTWLEYQRVKKRVLAGLPVETEIFIK